MLPTREHPPRLVAVVFDLWGTLMLERRELFPERARLRYEGAAPILARYGIETDVEDFTRRHLAANAAVGRMQGDGRDVSAEERARLVFYQFRPEAADRVAPEDLERFIEAYGGAIRHTPPRLLDGAREALEEARRRGLRVGLLSNTGVAGGRHVRGVLAAEGILSMFGSLVFSDEHRRSKPHPAIYEHALAELGATAGQALFVGDTPRYDVAPPRRYGWWVVQVGERDERDPPAHVRVPGVSDVFEAVERLGLRTPV